MFEQMSGGQDLAHFVKLVFRIKQEQKYLKVIDYIYIVIFC